MSKAALDVMALDYMEQFKGEISVIALNPGFVATNLSGDVEAMGQAGAGDPVELETS